VGFYFWQVFVFRVLFFCFENFLTILVWNNNKITENDVHMVWVKKQVIMCWFVTFASFRAKWRKLVSVIVLSCIDVKQQQNDRKLCAKDLGEKCSHLRLVVIPKIMCKRFGWKLWLFGFGFYFWQVFVFRVLFFCFEHFLTILVGNNNKMTENYVHMVWVQKQVIMC